MFDFNWRQAYEAWEPDEYTTAREEAFRAGWAGAMEQIMAMLEDQYSELKPVEGE